MGGSNGEELDLLIQEYFDCDLERDQLPGSKHEYHNKTIMMSFISKAMMTMMKASVGILMLTSSTKTKP